jgi:hypothetical protein
LILIEDQSFLTRFVKGFGNNAEELAVSASNSLKIARCHHRGDGVISVTPMF